MNRLLFVLPAVLLLASCSKEAPLQAVSSPDGARGSNALKSAMAYQHTLRIETEEDQVAGVFEAAQAACRDASADACVVLQARIGTGRSAFASLTVRARPAGIRKVTDVLSKQGRLADRSTNAEDLQGPIEDGARKLAMLKDYRAKLEVLQGKAANDVDALIKLSRELSQAQSEIEAMTGRQAHLVQRVETEILNVTIDPSRNHSFWRPIGEALSGFGRSLSEGFGIAITASAYLLPWALGLTLLGWIVRKLWRRRKRGAAAQAESTSG